MQLEVMTVNSMEKIFPDQKPNCEERENSCLRNEVFSFQIAFKGDKESMLQEYSWEVKGPLADYVQIRPVQPVPCTTPRSSLFDEDYLFEHGVLVPDVLTDEKWFYIRYDEWQSLWVTVKGELPCGEFDIEIFLKTPAQEIVGKVKYTLHILDLYLPKQTLHYAHWFHYDALADYYHLPVFSEAYNTVMWAYVKNAIAHGVDTLLIPLFTPPLNVGVGLERTTVQLIDVAYDGSKYLFDFSRFSDFLAKARRLGIKIFEMSHLFTQWGAEYAPKIMATVNGEYTQIFGWKDKADGEKYTCFLTQFLKELVVFLQENGYGADECVFHLSDEPNCNHLEHYMQLQQWIKPILGEYKISDALSEYEYYKLGIVDVPVVVTDSADKFLGNDVENLWVYYCCGQGYNHLSNRFLSMPLQRTRILGFQLYLTGCKGFLHWGYNYYNSALSERTINPYFVTDACGSFPSGDSFIVYPSDKGTPYDSIRHEVMYDAFQDYRALCLLEEKVGRWSVVRFLKENGMQANFTHYPNSATWHTEMRRKINQWLNSND